VEIEQVPHGLLRSDQPGIVTINMMAQGITVDKNPPFGILGRATGTHAA
jgi:hypothetical protein